MEMYCPAGTTCLHLVTVSEVDPDASLSDMVDHLRSAHECDLDEALDLISRSAD